MPSSRSNAATRRGARAAACSTSTSGSRGPSRMTPSPGRGGGRAAPRGGGHTAARPGARRFNTDVWLKRAIENALVPGPRLAASGREICGVGGLMDWNPDFRKIGMEGLVLLVNGPDQARAAVRKLVKDGVEWVKTYPTGDAAAPDRNDPHTPRLTL